MAEYENDDERAVGRSWLAALTAWMDAVRPRVTAPARQAGLPPEPVMVLSENGRWVEQLNELVRPTLLGVLRRAYDRLSGQQPPGGFDQSQYVTDYLNASVNRMTGIPDEVYRLIAAQIAEGVTEGESIPDIAARVDDVLTVSGSQRWQNRAVVVARTEVTAANSAGALAAGAQLEITEGRRMVKTWVATTRPPSSERTRPSHLEADGQTVALREPFIVGSEGARMQYPGDPTGPADEVIQCRCTLIIRAADEGPTSMVDRQNPRGA